MNLYDTKALVRSMCFFYRTMVASAPLLEFAIPKSAGRLRAYYEKHLAEERGHEIMLLADLHGLGVKEVPLSHAAAQIAGSQYYLIAHEDPALLLGYMLAMEKDSLTLSQVDELAVHHGSELTALRHHCEHDPAHKVDLLAEIAALDPSIRDRVVWNERNVSQFLETALAEDF